MAAFLNPTRPLRRARSCPALTLFFAAFLLLLWLPGCSASPFAGPPDAGQENSTDRPVPESGDEEQGVAGKTGEEGCRQEQEEAPVCPEEERAALEEKRREERGDLYVPLPAGPKRENPPVKARGIYMTGHTVGLESRYRSLLEMIKSTELNSVVIDVKNDHGNVTYQSDICFVEDIDSHNRAPIRDMRAVLEELEEKDIYPIARVVVFRDPYLANKRPEWAIQKKEGGVWADRKGMSWLDPYQKKVWDYSIAVAQEAALLGFREIQFDYVRFPENAERVEQEARFPARSELLKEEVIREFLIYAGEKLEDYNVYLSADVFGVIATSWGDSDDIGQTWEEIAPYVDYMCPMVYPSHYGSGYFDYSVPDAHPAGTVRYALRDSIKRNAPLGNPGIIRPWLQGFTAGWIRGNIQYGPAEIRAQIDAAFELGIDEFLIWNARNRYYPDAFLTEEKARERFESYERSRKEAGLDALGNTPTDAVEHFLEAAANGDWREVFSLHRTERPVDFRTYREWFFDWRYLPKEHRVRELQLEGGAPPSRTETLQLNVDLRLTGDEREFRLSQQEFEVKLENQIWRVTPSALFYSLVAGPANPEGEGGRGLSHRP